MLSTSSSVAVASAQRYLVAFIVGTNSRPRFAAPGRCATSSSSSLTRITGRDPQPRARL